VNVKFLLGRAWLIGIVLPWKHQRIPLQTVADTAADVTTPWKLPDSLNLGQRRPMLKQKKVQKSKVNVYLYSASSRSASNALPIPLRRRWSPQASPPARHQRTLRDHGYRLVYHMICLFTLPAFAGYSFQPNHRGQAMLSRPRCLVVCWGGLPVQRRSPTQALTRPSVE